MYKTVILILLVLLSSCKFPNFFSSKTKGIDGNSGKRKINHIIKEIESGTPDPNIRNAIENYASIKRKLLVLDEDQASLKKWWRDSQLAFACVHVILKYGDKALSTSEVNKILSSIEGEVLNSRSNLLLNDKKMSLFHMWTGGNLYSSALEEIILLDEVCQFKVLNKRDFQKSAINNYLTMKRVVSEKSKKGRIFFFEEKHGTSHRKIYEHIFKEK